MNNTIRRLHKEFNNIKKNPSENCTARPINDDYYNWEGNIFGPTESPYEGGLFKLSIIIPKEYPLKPPKIKFITKIYHPNIDANGNICLDILKNAWSPALNISKTLLSITSLLADPNIDDPLSYEISELYKKDYVKFIENARNWTYKYAS